MADLWQNRLFLDASIKGEFPEELVSLLQEENVLWQSEAEDLKRIKENKVDLWELITTIRVEYKNLNILVIVWLKIGVPTNITHRSINVGCG